MRLNKYVASSSDLSRREADRAVQAGEVRVNGEVCVNPALDVSDGDEVRLGRRVLKPRVEVTVAYHKPRGLVCTRSDEFKRPTIYHKLPPRYRHLNHVGRLDLDSEGLLILTNDGQLAQVLTHPSQKVEKEYQVTLGSAYRQDLLDQLVKGVTVEELGRVKAKAASRISARRASIVLETGLKRQLRLMFQTLGFRVQKLVRVRVGSLTLGQLPLGGCEELTSREIARLLKNPSR